MKNALLVFIALSLFSCKKGDSNNNVNPNNTQVPLSQTMDSVGIMRDVVLRFQYVYQENLPGTHQAKTSFDTVYFRSDNSIMEVSVKDTLVYTPTYIQYTPTPLLDGYGNRIGDRFAYSLGVSIHGDSTRNFTFYNQIIKGNAVIKSRNDVRFTNSPFLGTCSFTQ